MKQLIKAATVYKAEIPVDASTLHNHLAEKSFTELQELELLSVGFIPPSTSCSLVTEFPGGMAFRVRIDEKIIPGAALQKEVNRLAKHVLDTAGRKVGKKERAELKELARANLAVRAFARTAELTCFYETATGYLIVPTTSQKLADRAITQLVHAVGSVKTTTINVSSVKHGLTTRLKTWLDNEAEDNPEDFEPAFGRFAPVAEVALVQETRRINVKMGNLDEARAGLQDALGKGFQATSLGLTLDGGTEFRLTDGFRLKGIEFSHGAPEDEDLFASTAALEVAAVSAVVTELCAMLSYKDEGEEQGELEEVAS